MTRALAIVLWTVLVLFAGAEPTSATDVHGDDAGDRYVGTGGLILPMSVGTQTRQRVSRCGDCHWRLASVCEEPPAPPGVPMPGQAPQSPCLSVVRGCPGGAELLRAWFQQSGGPWADLGLICLADGGPHTIEELTARVREAFAADLPTLRPAFQPAAGILAQIPVVFRSGQPAEPFTAVYDLLGQRVALTATPRWTWRFGDGAALVTDDPGGLYPHMTVAHPYRHPGRFDVGVSTSWSGEFSLDDLGTFPVPEPVRQEAASTVRVGQGRAVLAVR